MPERRAARPLDSEELWQHAVKTLAGRAYSIGEMRQKLHARAQRVEDVVPILSRLQEAGYLNDQRFAESYTAVRIESEGFGKSRVVRDLVERRVAPALAYKTVEQAYQSLDETQLIEDFIRRRYRRTPKEGLFDNQKDLASAYRKLMRAGFGPGNVLRVLKQFAKNPELLDNVE